MAIINLKDLRAALPRHGRLIGLDPGTKTIGVALSDVTLMLASPYGALKRGKLAANAAEIAAYAGVSELTARAMIAHARVEYSRGEA